MLPPDPNLARDLSAFADGELDAAATQRMREHIAADPAAGQIVRAHQQLNAEARRVVVKFTPAVPDALRERLQQMGDERLPVPRPAKPRWVGWSAAAASVIVAFTAGFWCAHRSTRAIRTASAADVIPAAIVAHAEEIHGVCSRLALGLHSGGYPSDVSTLAPAVEQDLHSDHPYPDLTKIGYAYRGASPCGWPLPETAHLLYRSLRPGSINAVSVFVQFWRGQYALDPGRLYTVSVAQSPFPMLVWRSEHVVYFLLADNAKTEQGALAVIRGPR